jgi:hypothetical protein
VILAGLRFSPLFIARSSAWQPFPCHLRVLSCMKQHKQKPRRSGVCVSVAEYVRSSGSAFLQRVLPETRYEHCIGFRLGNHSEAGHAEFQPAIRYRRRSSAFILNIASFSAFSGASSRKALCQARLQV